MKRISALAFLFLLFVSALYVLFIPSVKTVEPLYTRLNFSDLEGWQSDNHDQALEAFQISCKRLMSYPDDRNFGDFGIAIDWKPVCIAAQDIDPIAAKKFFETNFVPLSFARSESGLFTGYYAPLYKGSREESEHYNVPLYTVPDDLQALSLGDFDLSLKGRSIVGEVIDNKFVPYKDRKLIDQGALVGQSLELVWLEKKAESFFMQIQGSGFIELDNGEIMHLGYAQKNGRPYRAIGQFLIESGDVAREDMSLQAIYSWMEDNPEKSDELMWKNPSYVFFQQRNSDKPVGSLGIGLTPGRSLAVDREHIPLGMPLWLETHTETTNPLSGEILKQPHLSRLVVAQDTGGAIKGKIRGDVYWGIGAEAEIKAGPMKDRGGYYLLIPAPLFAKLAPLTESAS
ncbi:MAG: murein transglycosylase [Kordiimonadaceae bacterium]|nr:murein transglycosylase [Kordiimonadaceae bacterium]MBT6035539.1 murein transglycosylase [Kordiimonadaceae bacterium]MBT6328409.1 murein transglycosylase [Kordiimonadaceae bacterium]